MAIVSLVIAVVMLILVGIGIAVGLVACALAAVLIGLGVISSSVVVGFRSGQAGKGIRVFLLQCGIIAGIPAGMVCAWLTSTVITELEGVVNWPVLICGGFGGALAGILVALVLDQMGRRLHGWASRRFPALAQSPGGS